MNFNSKEYKRARRAYLIQSTVEYFVAILVTDAFLAKLLTHIGISDPLIGIISSFISLAFVTQLMSILLVRKNINSKRVSIILETVSIFLFMLLYLVPFVPLGKTGKTIVIVVCIIFAYATKYIVNSIVFKWCNSFVEPSNRAVYSAKKEMFSLFSGMIFTFIAGYIIDIYEGIGNLNGGFLFIAFSIFALNISNFICFSCVSEEKINEQSKICGQKNIHSVVTNTVGNKAFRKVMFLTMMYDSARYFTVGFLGIYEMNDLMMSMSLIQTVNILGCFARMIISIPFGRFSDKFSYAMGFKAALCLMACSFAINIFTTPHRWYLIFLYAVLFNCSIAGTNQNSFNITYNYVNKDYLVEAMAIKNSIGGIVGFFSAIVASKILEFIQKNGNTFLGYEVYGQQILSLISLCITISAIVFIKFKIEKEKVVIQ